MYIRFLDSDDAAHPMLLEEMIKQTQQHGVQMVFCHSVELEDHEMNAALSEVSAHDVRPDWRIGDALESERWFHIDYLDALGGIGGLIPRELIGSLRFDTSLAIGEDGLIKNQLFAWQVPVAYTSMPWYFWRINYQGLCHNISLAVGARAAEKARGSGVSSIAREIWNTPKYGRTCSERQM